MDAVTLHAFGPAENLTYEEHTDPLPSPGQIRVAVAAAGVHVVDVSLRNGDRRGPYQLPELPTVLGREVAGTVDALGEGVDAGWLGRRVVAHLGPVPGGYAELAVFDAARAHRIPDGLSEDQAVAMVGTGRTALAVLAFTELTGDDVVVVTAAAGGVGSLLVQHAKNAGATVVGLAGGPAKVARVRDLGADIALDYSGPLWHRAARSALGGRTATVVFDGVAGPAARAAVDLLGPGGTHLSFGWATANNTDRPLTLDPDETATRSITSRNVLGRPMLERAGGPEGMHRLQAASLAQAATGTVVPLLTRFPLAGAAAAHRALETRATVGKVVLMS